MKSGFVAIVGRPNAGKSTLVNAIVGHKVAIVSDKPQTTRRAIRGVLTLPDEWQIVLVDLPGVQRPRDTLTKRMQDRVEYELSEADAVLFVLNGVEGVDGPGDRFIANVLLKTDTPITIAVNKVDRLDRSRTIVALDQASQFDLSGEIFPVSALTGQGVQPLLDHLLSLLPEAPFYFPTDKQSDVSESVHIGELVREQVLQRTRQEVPHAVEVHVEEITHSESLITIQAYVFVETESQKGILIGNKGQMIKTIGTAARLEIERELGQRVHLDLSVRVRNKWRTDPVILDRLDIR